jgi:hypothetical protein
VEQLPNTSLGYAYTNDLQVSQLSYAGGVVNYGYDDDRLPVGAGAFEFNSLRGDYWENLRIHHRGSSLEHGGHNVSA